jgi:hypothetical protein
VVRGDSTFFFAFNRSLKESDVARICDSRIATLQTEIFPGLLLRDEEGNILKPELQVVLVPAEEEL